MRVAAKKTISFKLCVTLLLSVCWVSGVLFYALDKWFISEGDYGPVKHSWQYPTLQVHAAVSFFIIIGFGHMLGAHIPRMWRLKHKYKTGVALIIFLVFLILTTYGLYYIAHPYAREVIANMHFIMGLALPAILAIHIFLKIKCKKKYV